jgi:3-deoxy-D-manno-octulosonic-acid transferase
MQLAAPFHGKAAAWVSGRRELFPSLDSYHPGTAPVVWVHAASAGEFEQAKPVIEALREAFPAVSVLVTFFSPSGYQAARKYAHADFMTYLPLDIPGNAGRFLQQVRPSLVLWIKYDYWYHHLKAAESRGVPVLLLSAIFRPGQVFFKGYGRAYRPVLSLFRHLFVQDTESAQLLRTIGVSAVTVSGDTRFDRVSAIAEKFSEVPFLASFAEGQPVLVAGSTWPADEQLLAESFHDLPRRPRLVIAPHEITEHHIANIMRLFPRAVRYSYLRQLTAEGGDAEAQKAEVLIIDNIGMLSRLYRYATIAYIGGGFGAGIHNTLEAAVYGKPVLFGPKYGKFREAHGLIAAGGARSVRSKEEAIGVLQQWIDGEAGLLAGQAAGSYVKKNRGATAAVIQYIQENRLLTR